MIEIRLAISLDAPELNKLNALFNGDGNNTVGAIEDSLKENGREIVYVAADGNKLVGFCCGQIMKSMCYSYKYAEITELYVTAEYRRQGVGRLLFCAMENELGKRGARHLHVLTGSGNLIAQALYRSCGYRETSEMLFDKNMGG
jgi:ribosomal protein S18 acetylase RimI-like enzyme